MIERNVILFELNEVPFRILDEYCRREPDSQIARRLGQCRQYETRTEDKGHLSPWKTWPSLHRGVNNERHRLHDFGQDLAPVDREYPPIWQLTSSHGVSTGVCGSLFTYPIPDSREGYSFYLPDTFAAGSECVPEAIVPFQEFNLTMARASARNVSSSVPWKTALKMIAELPELGFKPETAAWVGRQLAEERLHSWKRIRRRTYQSVLGFDVFMRQLEKTRPAFSTFFTNHVASSMHRYWAALFPGDYEEYDFGEEWKNTYKNEVVFTMGWFDRFFSRLVHFADKNPSWQVWIASSMGQAATKAKEIETELHVTDVSRFMTGLGVPRADWEERPAMLPQINIAIPQVSLRDGFRAKLESLSVAGERVRYRAEEGGFFSVDFGHQNVDLPGGTVDLGGRRVPIAELGMSNVTIEDKCGANAYHIPEGILLIYDPADRSPKAHLGRTRLSTLDLAPALLENFGVPVPGYMRSPAAGSARLS